MGSIKAKVTQRADDYYRIHFVGAVPEQIPLQDRQRPFDTDHRRWGTRSSKDMQKFRAYKAEDASRIWGEDQVRFSSLRQVATYCRRLISTAWFQRRWPEFTILDVCFVPTLRGACANSREYSRSAGGYINLGRWALGCRPGRHNPDRRGGEWLVLHELAHAIAPSIHKHDALWARIYLELVKFRMGSEAHSRLQRAFDEKGVRYRQPRVLTEEQRREAAERMRALRLSVASKACHDDLLDDDDDFLDEEEDEYDFIDDDDEDDFLDEDEDEDDEDDFLDDEEDI